MQEVKVETAVNIDPICFGTFDPFITFTAIYCIPIRSRDAFTLVTSKLPGPLGPIPSRMRQRDEVVAADSCSDLLMVL